MIDALLFRLSFSRILMIAGFLIMAGGLSFAWAVPMEHHQQSGYSVQSATKVHVHKSQKALNHQHSSLLESEPCETQQESTSTCHADGCCLFEVPSIDVTKLFVGFRKSFSAPLAEKPMLGNPVKSPERPPEYL